MEGSMFGVKNKRSLYSNANNNNNVNKRIDNNDL